MTTNLKKFVQLFQVRKFWKAVFSGAPRVRVSSREQSPTAKTIWLSIRLRKFGYDVNVRQNADCTDSEGGGRKSGVNPSGEEYID